MYFELLVNDLTQEDEDSNSMDSNEEDDTDSSVPVGVVPPDYIKSRYAASANVGASTAADAQATMNPPGEVPATNRPDTQSDAGNN